MLKKPFRPCSVWTKVWVCRRPFLGGSPYEYSLDFDKANEILFRLGIIYKQQAKYRQSLECFDKILRNPPNPLAHADIWFQIGHVYEQEKDVS
jgi:tetratricopeptide (TPR) repeat protein